MATLLTLACASVPPRKSSMTATATEGYPATRTEDVTDTLHGVVVRDPYRWLENGNDPEVRAWMAAQNAYATARLAALPRRDALVKRFRELYYLDALSAPVHRGLRYFYVRTHADREKAIVYWRQGRQGPERVLLDPNGMSSDGSTSLGVWVPSWDGTHVAYTLHENNADDATLFVVHVASAQTSKVDVIEGAKYAVPSWTPSGDGFYYTWLPVDPAIPVADRPGFAEVRFHALGTDPKMDARIYEKTGDAQTFIGGQLSRDGEALVVTIARGWTRTDVFLRRKGETGFRPIFEGKDAQAGVTVWKGKLYITTNLGAPRWRILVADLAAPEEKSWREIVPEDPEAVIEGADVVGGYLVINYLDHASSRIEVRTLEGDRVREVPLPGLGTASQLLGNPDEDEAYFSFASFTHPPEIHRVSMGSGQLDLWEVVKVPVDPTPFAVEQVSYPSKDGTRVSMFLVHRRDLVRDGSTPFMLSGYGGFNVTMLSSFNAGIYPWLEAGGGLAVPNLRGGGEYGEQWHRAGMLDRKQNVFDDFIAAAEYLVEERLTRPEKLAIRGGSNGGLLVGAAMTQRPDLFAAVVCQVPLLDMLRYHLFGSGRTWVPEYGSADDEKAFRTLFAYSPYHHVKPGTRYAAVLMLSADSDDRVDPMHARKMAAALQSVASPGRPVWLRIEHNAGHGGADMVRQAVEQSVDTAAFLFHELGM